MDRSGHTPRVQTNVVLYPRGHSFRPQSVRLLLTEQGARH